MIRLAPLFILLMGQPAHGQTETICTDRPTKGNAPCTVPTGRIQVEADLWSLSASNSEGRRVESSSYLSPVFKLGLTVSSDLQLGIPLWSELKVAGADRARISGVGDVIVRYKHRLTDTNERTQVAIIPFVKAPTAKNGLGNGEWEGGVILPITLKLNDRLELNLGPEIDLLAKSTGSGHYVQLVGLAAITTSLPRGFGASIELWSSQGLEANNNVDQYSFDAAFTYQSRADTLFDLGVNLGLNRATADAQLYVGLSRLF